MTTEQLEELLLCLLDSARRDDMLEDGASVRRFADTGLLTRDRGLLLRAADGSEFQVTIVRSRGPRKGDDE